MKGTLKTVKVFDLNKEFSSLRSQLKPAGTKERERCVDNALHGEQQSCSVLPKSPYRIGIWKKNGKGQSQCDLSLFLRKLRLPTPPQTRDLI